MTTAAGQRKHQLYALLRTLWIYRHCTLVELLWAKVALFFVVHEHDLTMDALHNRRIYKANI